MDKCIMVLHEKTTYVWECSACGGPFPASRSFEEQTDKCPTCGAEIADWDANDTMY